MELLIVILIVEVNPIYQIMGIFMKEGFNALQGLIANTLTLN